MTYRSIVRIIIATLFCGLPLGRAENDVLWMGFKYSVSVKLAGTPNNTNEPAHPRSLPMPEYPAKMMNAAVSGDVVVKITVMSEGVVDKIEIISADFEAFSASVRRAVRQWNFSPLPKGKTGTRQVTCRFEFRATE